MFRRTPCIGICSTTYGDLVCRGCKRFAHEIVGWNGYERSQRDAVWLRLLALRAGAIAHFIALVDTSRLLAATAGLPFGERLGAAVGAPGTAPQDADLYLRACEALRHCAADAQPLDRALAALGLEQVDPRRTGTVEELLHDIDQEFFRRSTAHYERNYRTPAR